MFDSISSIIEPDHILDNHECLLKLSEQLGLCQTRVPVLEGSKVEFLALFRTPILNPADGLLMCLKQFACV